MTIDIDPRLEARRWAVAEHRARSRLRRVLLLVGTVAMAGAVAWTLRSPLFVVRHLVLQGADEAVADEVAIESGLRTGIPMIEVDAEAVVTALEADPRIRSARVELRWPHTVWVVVEVRPPVAWVQAAGGWAMVGVDGVVLETAPAPDGSLPVLELDPLSPAGRAGLVFLAELDLAWRTGARVLQRGGELWVEAGGVDVRLGGIREMEAKAHALGALLAEGPDPASVINLIAPARPAVVRPPVEQSQSQGNAESSGDTQAQVEPDG